MRRLVLVVALLILISSFSGVTVASTPSYQTKTGVALDVGPSTEKTYLDQMNNIVEKFGLEPRSNAFVITDGKKSWVVFTNSKPRTGKAKVRGTVISASELNSDFGVIFADSVSWTLKGEPTSLSKIRENPSEYHAELVRVKTHYRQISYLVEAAEGQYVTKVSGAALGGSSSSLVGRPGAAGKWAVLNLSGGEYGQSRAKEANQRIGTQNPAINYNQKQFWVNAQATVDLVVLDQGGKPTFYVAQVDVHGQQVQSVQEIARRGAELKGKVVTVESQVVGAKVSSQELLLSVAQCAPDSVTNPVTGCIPVPTDSVVHTGILFQGVPDSRSDVVTYAGLSNEHQQKVATPEKGTYRVTGRVVSTNQIDPDLPDGYALIVYEMEKTGHLQAQQAAVEKVSKWKSQAVNQVKGQITSSGSNQTSDSEASGSQNEQSSGPANVFVSSATIVENPIEDTTGEVRVVLKNTGGSTGSIEIDFMTGATYPESKFVRSYSVKPGKKKVLTFTVELTGSHTGTRIWVNGKNLGLLERNLPDTPEPTESSGDSRPFGDFSEIFGFSLGVGSAFAWLSAIVLESLRTLKSWRGHIVQTSDLPGAVLVASGTILGSLSLYSYGQGGLGLAFGGIVFGTGAIVFGLQWIYAQV